jgi:hypothetical protein
MPERVSRGQAEAVLNAGPSGGSAIRNRSGGVLRAHRLITRSEQPLGLTRVRNGMAVTSVRRIGIC